VFESDPRNLNQELRYKLRFPSTPSRFLYAKNVTTWKTELTFPEISIPGPRKNDSVFGDNPGYYEEGFMTLQHLISLAVVNYTSISNTSQLSYTVNAQIMPYPPFIYDIFLTVLQFMLPMIFMISFISPVASLTKNIVLEKERRLKEYMKMMGLKNWLHWMAWFIKTLVMLTISIMIITVILCVKLKDGVGILNKSDWSVIFVFFILYSISSISFGFMLSTFFSKVTIIFK
jgi:ATP-binding cassette, subfamily A (ABC1), member 3